MTAQNKNALFENINGIFTTKSASVHLTLILFEKSNGNIINVRLKYLHKYQLKQLIFIYHIHRLTTNHKVLTLNCPIQEEIFQPMAGMQSPRIHLIQIYLLNGL